MCPEHPECSSRGAGPLRPATLLPLKDCNHTFWNILGISVVHFFQYVMQGLTTSSTSLLLFSHQLSNQGVRHHTTHYSKLHRLIDWSTADFSECFIGQNVHTHFVPSSHDPTRTCVLQAEPGYPVSRRQAPRCTLYTRGHSQPNIFTLFDKWQSNLEITPTKSCNYRTLNHCCKYRHRSIGQLFSSHCTWYGTMF